MHPLAKCIEFDNLCKRKNYFKKIYVLELKPKTFDKKLKKLVITTI